MATKRERNGSWEFIIKRKAILGKPYTRTFESEEEGDRVMAHIEAQLDAGVVPIELQETGKKYRLLVEVIRDYLLRSPVADNDKPLLSVIIDRIGTTPLSKISYEWVEGWIEGMKTTLNLKPGTIRHHVGALRRCFDWASRKNIIPLVSNPIRMLPINYAQYSRADIISAKKIDGAHIKQEDTERDRRLEPFEEIRIRNALDKPTKDEITNPSSMRYQAAREAIFNVALETAMRLREIYTLSLDQVDFEKSTIFLEKTKNGNKRQVPMSSTVKKQLREYIRHVEQGTRGMQGFQFTNGRLMPWWTGSLERKSLELVTIRLSQQFRRVFDRAECRELKFHDLRHEATSRFFERTQLTEFEIMKITGHSSTRMLRRYSNLRGSNLAEKLW